MKSINECIRERRSVRAFDGRPLDENIKQQLLSFAETAENPYGIPVSFKLMDAKAKGLSCPVVTGTDLYMGGKIKTVANASVAFGYSFESVVLYAQALGIGTVWLGGTMNRSAFEAAMELAPDEMMPCASPLGYAATKMSVRETVMRKGVKADERLPFGELFFDGSFEKPLTPEKAGSLAEPLEMVRLAPSAVNRQPWRVIVKDNMVHFYLKRSKGFKTEGNLDMQMIDMGIALCHFALSAKEEGLDIRFVLNDPFLTGEEGTSYIASYRIL